jgi:hypothetical protein
MLPHFVTVQKEMEKNVLWVGSILDGPEAPKTLAAS